VARTKAINIIALQEAWWEGERGSLTAWLY